MECFVLLCFCFLGDVLFLCLFDFLSVIGVYLVVDVLLFFSPVCVNTKMFVCWKMCVFFV